MYGVILCAGLGKRLYPLTENLPKALVSVGGKPMLFNVVEKLSKHTDRIILNIHHFGDKIIDYVNRTNFESEILISDEREELLDTGGALVKILENIETQGFIRPNKQDLEPKNQKIGTQKNNGSKDQFLIHNVDILSDFDLERLIAFHNNNFYGLSLLVSDRESSRKLIFSENDLEGWHNLSTGEIKLKSDIKGSGKTEFAFSGIYIIDREAIMEMREIFGQKKFSLIDYLLSDKRKIKVGHLVDKSSNLVDIGKPATLAQASEIILRFNSDGN